MSRFTAIGAALAFGLVLASPAAGALEVRVSITPKRPHALERRSCWKLRVGPRGDVRMLIRS